MSSESTSQVQCYACVGERWIDEPFVSRDKKRIRFGQGRQALLVFEIPTGPLFFAVHAGNPSLTVCGETPAPATSAERRSHNTAHTLTRIVPAPQATNFAGNSPPVSFPRPSARSRDETALPRRGTYGVANP